MTMGLFMFTAARSRENGPLAAGALITVISIVALFVLFQRQVTEGFISGAVKG